MHRVMHAMKSFSDRHGRVKVRTTEQEQEAKRKEREQKLKAYKAGIESVFRKRQDGEFDDELLSLTAQLLVGNPDIYTLWNIRREVLLLYKTKIAEEELGVKLEKEVSLTEQCLRSNPKSYGAWFHRGWALDQHHAPDWHGELVLFHCWDYRRLVVSRSNASPQDEFLFSTVKIEDNFSNYSAWHYRSKLLPIIHPDSQGLCPIKLAMVQSAAFTDPNDTSAWFYQRWLLGRDCSLQQRPRASPCLAWLQLTDSVALVSCSEPTSEAPSLFLGDQKLAGNWWQPSSHVWILQGKKWPTEMDETVDFKVTAGGGVLQLSAVPGKERCYWGKPVLPSSKYSPNVTAELQEQLASCEQLLQFEPDSKWTLLTSVLLMQAIDSKLHHSSVLSALEKLPKVDPMRVNYYHDLRSKYMLEHQLPTLLGKGQSPVLSISLKSLQLTALYYMHLLALVQEVDLAHNDLTEPSLPALSSLQRCNRLVLSHNQLTSLKGFPSMPALCSLSLQGNQLSAEPGVVLGHLEAASLSALYELNLEDNPCHQLPELQSFISGLAKRK
ncbi:hypothetical protein B566_EDAN007862 [Ephemera danica]|nr:hypothetical protein B566_EDAN007862 [Ephemera danica]